MSYLDDENRRYGGRESKLARKLVRLDGKIAARDAEILAIKERTAKVKAETEETQAKLAKVQGKNAERQKQIDDLKEKTAAIRLQIAEANGRIAALQTLTSKVTQ